MAQLTIGYVAGIIAAAIFVARLWTPNIIALIISALLRDRASASTWSVASRAFQRSHWPDILSGDMTLIRGVRKDIMILTRLMGYMGALIGIAGVVTPLGLYQTLLSDDNVQTPFKYLADTSPYGYGTPPRSNFSFNRYCGGGFGPAPCPFTDSVSITSSFPNGTIQVDFPYGIDMEIPEIVNETFSSGTDDHTTISNFFDIQWRRYSTESDPDETLNNGSSYLTGAFRTIQTLVMNNAMEAVEGLVVDNMKGGIGFRNHTVPPGFKYGVNWEEDLLFVEPETVCVDTNITMDFTVVSSNGTAIKELVLTDRGGFVNINTTYPLVDMDDPQSNPNLHQRAYTAAWLQNAMIMLLWNLTNPKEEDKKSFSYIDSHINKSYRIQASSGLKLDGTENLKITADFGDFVLSGDVGTSTNSSIGDTNPWGISSENFTVINLLCSGAGSGDFANSSNILVSCGSMIGVPQRMNPGHPLVFDRGSVWSQKLFTCATGVKATVKTVSFNYNGTDNDMKNLAITSIKEKEYNDNASIPLWGVEDTGNAFKSDEINLIWGLISQGYEKKPNVTTIRASSLYLPGYAASGALSGGANDAYNIPAATFPIGAVNSAYCVSAGGVDCDSFTGNDYSGANNMAMWARWQNLTQDAESASTIPNLIWTDTAASAVVGTKGVLGPGNTAQENRVALFVIPTVQKIRYHYLYAIPALLTALLLALITFVALVVSCFRGIKIGRMRTHLHQISPGRIFTTFLYPGPSGMTISSKEWGRHLGIKQIDLAKDFPVAAEVLNAPEKGVLLTTYERSAHSTEGEVLIAHSHTRETSQGDIGYGFAQPQQYHSP